ncbi:hypothetical protein FGO68_gene2168 [Halteria grandinella]|uniref:Uncharacterized protein n=1 Tax=Halteria grandinella TaxID=5974 RepID=A0A8J8T513_HALGN|nr:hypothetical protein FGO68_gene2168 [Halteria grandinella]
MDPKIYIPCQLQVLTLKVYETLDKNQILEFVKALHTRLNVDERGGRPLHLRFQRMFEKEFYLQLLEFEPLLRVECEVQFDNMENSVQEQLELTKLLLSKRNQQLI